MSHKRVIVAGASGFIGRALSVELDKRGYDTVCAVRNKSTATALPGKVFEVGAIDSKTDWHSGLIGVDVIVYLAGRAHVFKERYTDPLAKFREVNAEGAVNMAHVAQKMDVQRFLYVSSIGVNGCLSNGQPFTEVSDEAPYNDYTLSKLEAERALLRLGAESNINIVVIRPPLVYGPNNPGNFLRLLRLVQSGIPLPLASVVNRRSMIYVRNLVDVLIACAVHPNSLSGLYLVSDGEDISTPDLIRHLSRLMDRPDRLWTFPPGLLKYLGKILGKSDTVGRLIGSLEIDSSKIRKELSWEPPYSMEYGLMETVQWYLKTV